MKSRFSARSFISLLICLAYAVVGNSVILAAAAKEGVKRDETATADLENGQAAFRAELDRLAAGQRKQGVDIVRECEAGKADENLNLGFGRQWIVIAAAAADSNSDAGMFKKRYPEIWRRAWVVDIADFDRSGRRKILVRRFGQPSSNLMLCMLDPAVLRTNKEKVQVGFTDLGGVSADQPYIRGDALIRIVEKPESATIQISRRVRQMKPATAEMGFFAERIVLEFTGHSFKIVDRARVEITRREFERGQ